ncbi:hypothetical protein GLP30_18910 [Photobacterium phosphoreum]|uniref:Uncharacterized protein n=1 Tax=Photobacterium phosphoreum TaxID=659 RepID=A0AAW5A3Y5_PHOPO|nr:MULTISPECIES: hypothetical protein [Photobacterium]MCD9465112.1 hypothetical protein [Photobacterium phosphoreum]MCD9472667.1 hypothetical protein [Photobacterium phosphoreum]MCD9481047.1 hypothetical protein [Photobacterium phosphoreum]MCD9485383.1 hypothetical protein [Photobacterium phosphoreum]MCD9492914.1 hypothetical protein [Photobacterium phosphoreum]
MNTHDMNLNLLELDFDAQAKINQKFNFEKNLSIAHCAVVNFCPQKAILPDSYRSIDDPKYQHPTQNEFNEVVEHLAQVHSLGVVSKMLGIYRKNDPNKTIKNWMNGAKIPYTAWRMLLVLDGRVVQTNRLTMPDGDKPWAKYYD